MRMSDWEVLFAEDLAHIAAVADESTQATLERIAQVWQPMVRMRLLSMLSALAADINTLPEGAGLVDLRITGDDVTFVRQDNPQVAPVDEPVGETGEADSRISLRISEHLKDRITAAAAAQGMSVNTWIARTLDKSITQPTTNTQSRNSMRGYGRS